MKRKAQSRVVVVVSVPAINRSRITRCMLPTTNNNKREILKTVIKRKIGQTNVTLTAVVTHVKPRSIGSFEKHSCAVVANGLDITNTRRIYDWAIKVKQAHDLFILQHFVGLQK